MAGFRLQLDVIRGRVQMDDLEVRQVSFKKEVGVMVNDLVFWLAVWLNFENVLLTFKWYVFMWKKCSNALNASLPRKDKSA